MHERLYLDEINDHLDLVAAAEACQVEFNKIRPHEALAWNMPYEVHTGAADPTTPTLQRPGFQPTS